MSFSDDLRDRAAADYADFLLPHLDPSMRLLDAGCGAGTISIGLASHCGSITAIDSADNFAAAIDYAHKKKIQNVRFEAGDVYRTRFDDVAFEACFCHSVLEALAHPSAALDEFYRVLKPGGLIGVASVDYRGMLIGGVGTDRLRRFFDVRERLWVNRGLADPFFGRRLRGLLRAAGFEDVAATSKYISYGTADSVRRFGLARAAECEDAWYAQSAMEDRMLTRDELDGIRGAWLDWSHSDDAFLAFPLVSRDGLEGAMKPAPFDYVRAGTLEEALELLARHPDARPLAGGQSLIPMLAMRLARPSLLIDIGGLDNLGAIEERDGGVRVGATVRHAEIERSDLVRKQVPLLAEAIAYVGHPPIRARGTIGGSIVHADPAAELPLVAVTLDAAFTVATRAGDETVDAAEFFYGPMLTAMPDGGCLTSIDFPIWNDSSQGGYRTGSSFHEVATRRSDFALVATAAQVSVDRRGRCRRVVLGFAGLGDYPFTANIDTLIDTDLNEAVLDEALLDVFVDVDPIDDLHGSGAYRLRAAGLLARRALRDAFAEATQQETAG